jgi:hypothetical protein
VTAAALPGRSGEVQVAAVAYLTAGVPDRACVAVRVRLAHGVIVGTRADTVSGADANEQLGYTACAAPP